MAAAVYVMVGIRLRKPQTQGYARLASEAFRAWWIVLGTVTALGSLRILLVVADVTDLHLHVALSQVNLLGICVALWGLLYYLVYLFSGRGRAWGPLALFYFAFYTTILWAVHQAEAVAVTTDRWGVGLEYANPLDGDPLTQVLLALLILPILVGALAYFSLFFRLEGRTQRFRVGVVSWALIIWFSSSYLASIGGLSGRDWWQIASRALGLAAALAIYLAYNPPRWLRARGIRNLEAEEEKAGDVHPAQAPAQP